MLRADTLTVHHLIDVSAEWFDCCTKWTGDKEFLQAYNEIRSCSRRNHMGYNDFCINGYVILDAEEDAIHRWS
ncbi:hypothetical protein AF72_11190 [Xylella taiwanensis]|uniref:Uncharacterized protein n=1 Tax=Xylella taiwanensis TaxID=1444770 RepID=Z9JHC7_9GAMM|nr:hypothetical protein AB672_00265 [Xylella taiwanensis]EWS77413.1 hypothetical protein AF72_11190 [Xylella taiwanensis]